MFLKRALTGPLRFAVMTCLKPYEKKLLQQAPELRYVPCFLIGPPRSGTTLLYSLIITRFQMAYISNLIHRLYKTPVSAARIGCRFLKPWHRTFGGKNSYGHIPGWGAPCEGGWIWSQWMPERHYLDESHAEKLPVDRIRGIISSMCAIMGGPFFNKNVMHSVHMRLLDAIFPGCLFVHIKRDSADAIRSILRARIDHCPPDEWYSVKPREWESYKDSDHVTQACAQVFFIHKNIEEDISLLGPQRRLVLDFDDVCRSPGNAMERVSAFFKNHGARLTTRFEVPEKLKIHHKPFNDDIEDNIAREMERLWGAIHNNQ